MADSVTVLVRLAALFSLCLTVVRSTTVTHDWNVTWVSAKPYDGAAYYRQVMGINMQWPIPPLYVTKGDTVIINLYNGLGNETTSLHFHGMFMNGTTHMDGPPQVTQCAIPPGGAFVYNFTVDQPGTYWFHSHVRAQYPEGLRAPLIVRDPDSPYKDQYDEEVVLSFSDWYEDMSSSLMKSFLSYKNPTGAEPVPNAALMNDTQNLKFSVRPGRTYLLRLVNMAAFAPHYVWIEGHTMRVVEIDGVYTEPAETEMIYMTPAQRYGVLVTMRNDTDVNYPIMGSMDTDLFDVVPPSLNPNVTGWLVYDSNKPLPEPTKINIFSPMDDFLLVPLDKEPLWELPDFTATLSFAMDNLGDGANYGLINGISYTSPKVPSLYTALTSGSAATSAEVYGGFTNTFVLSRHQVVEIVVNNLDSGKHPFHLHGHNFQALSRSPELAGNYDANNASQNNFPPIPMRRDTLLVHPQSNFVIRFQASNPGVWLFHCHLEWHSAVGLTTTFVEAPLDLQKDLKLPDDHLTACKAQGIPISGNAAGNTANLFDLNGQNAPPAPLPAGFTPRGIVALVFSCISAFLGLAVIYRYGMLALPSTDGVERQESVVLGKDTDGAIPATSSQGVTGGSDDGAALRFGFSNRGRR